MPNTPRHPNLIFRVAVREVEAWLLADRPSMADFLEVPLSLIPVEPEASNDPKIEIVNLARGSSSVEVIDQMVPLPGSTAEVGRSFDRKLIQFVRDYWDIDNASVHSRSLQRAVAALERFTFTPHS